MKINYIDIHSHLNLSQFNTDADQVAQAMATEGVAAITVGTNIETSARAVALAEKHENLFACIGLHPVDDPESVIDVQEFEQLVQHPKVVAIGECGLDYFRLQDESDKQRQCENFQKQIDLAIKYDKALMLHIRPSAGTVDAYDDVITLLRPQVTEHGNRLRGNAHFFAGTVEQAQQLNALGFSVSVTGVITFTHDYDAVVKNIPLYMLHGETDAPFVAPVPHRGERNVPVYVKYVYEKIADIRGEDREAVRLQLLENARNMFGIAF